jgi:hypothetical protein
MSADPSHSTSPLSYAGGDAPPPRISRLAMASIPAGILTNPCLLAATLTFLLDRLPRLVLGRDLSVSVPGWGFFALMAALTLIPIAAVVRVHRLRRRWTAIVLAHAGLYLSLLSWLLVVLIALTFRGWSVAAG